MSNRDQGMPKPPPAQLPEVPEVPELSEKPSHTSEPKPPDSEKQLPPPVKSGIEVVATRPGFYRNSRKVAGDKFMVPNMETVGEWMKCTDPQAEKQHLEMIKKRKKK